MWCVSFEHAKGKQDKSTADLKRYLHKRVGKFNQLFIYPYSLKFNTIPWLHCSRYVGRHARPLARRAKLWRDKPTSSPVKPGLSSCLLVLRGGQCYTLRMKVNLKGILDVYVVLKVHSAQFLFLPLWKACYHSSHHLPLPLSKKCWCQGQRKSRHRISV